MICPAGHFGLIVRRSILELLFDFTVPATRGGYCLESTLSLHAEILIVQQS
jgi:hypothetical protein